MTFSIVAWDPDAREWGVSVASKFLAAGAVVPWVRAGAGAVATQAYANVTYGPRGLDLLATMPAQAAIDSLIQSDKESEHRQVGIVDGQGRTASFTGSECFDWAGSRAGEGYTCQGNILTGPEVVNDMAAAFEQTGGDLAGRLLAAMAAGDRAGGDRRGRQSAAMLISREGGGYLGDSDIALDLRVDDHPTPVDELGRLLDIHRLLFPNPDDLDFLAIDGPLAVKMAAALSAAGFETSSSSYDDSLRQALFNWVGNENLEMRWSEEPQIERTVLGILLEESL
ncbi:MAG: DUF1028 domain-containing protein [Acidimicrobiia bacterium]